MDEQKTKRPRRQTYSKYVLRDNPDQNKVPDINQAMATVLNELADIKRQLSTIRGGTDLISATELIEWLNISKPALYKLIKANKIPYQKRDRNYVFSRMEIDDWLKRATVINKNL